MEEIRRSPVEVGNLSHYFPGFFYIPGGCLGCLPSTVGRVGDSMLVHVDLGLESATPRQRVTASGKSQSSIENHLAIRTDSGMIRDDQTECVVFFKNFTNNHVAPIGPPIENMSKTPRFQKVYYGILIPEFFTPKKNYSKFTI